jgi:hypothetical protein
MNPGHTSLLLYLLAKLKPEAWDAIIPHGPKVSVAAREYLIAMSLKGFAAQLSNRAVVRKLGGIQQSLVRFAGERLAANYGDDDWCGTPWPRHFPFPVPGPGPDPFAGFSFSDVMLNPQPLPPKESQRQIGGYLLLLAEATSLEGVAKDLQAIGKSLVRG